MKSSILASVVQSVQSGRKTFFRYITANDVGTTGSHQSGFYVPKEGASVLFEKLGTKGIYLLFKKGFRKLS
ncbi:MAG: EcoRII N-terminal effector-binding domain-containing protein [Bacteroides sp.]